MPSVWSGSTGTAGGFKGPESEGPWSLRVGSVGREEQGGGSQYRRGRSPGNHTCSWEEGTVHG